MSRASGATCCRRPGRVRPPARTFFREGTSMNGRLVALAAVGLSAALAVASLNGRQEAVGQQPPKPVQWEYKVVLFRNNPDAGTKTLNELAADGWEYVGLVATPGG